MSDQCVILGNYLVQRQRLLWLSLAIETAINGRKAANFLHFTRVVIRHCKNHLQIKHSYMLPATFYRFANLHFFADFFVVFDLLSLYCFAHGLDKGFRRIGDPLNL